MQLFPLTYKNVVSKHTTTLDVFLGNEFKGAFVHIGFTDNFATLKTVIGHLVIKIINHLDLTNMVIRQ